MGLLQIHNSYATGKVSGNNYVGGLAGYINSSRTPQIINSLSISEVSGKQSVGTIVGSFVLSNDGGVSYYPEPKFESTQALKQDYSAVGGIYSRSGNVDTLIPDYDMTSMLQGVSDVIFNAITTTLQVGASSEEQCHLSFNTNFVFEFERFRDDISSDSMLNTIVDFMNQLSDESTKLGSVGNRLESVLDEIAIQYDNLVSSRSTIRDADMAEVSATYIQQQILQEAAATLMSTANQSPAIALQLI